MKRNLKTTTYRDGSAITFYSTLPGTNVAGYTRVNSSTDANTNDYGLLYTAFTLSGNTTSSSLCPIGWHVPSDAEFSTLNTSIGGNANSLKETGTTYWVTANGTNTYGFSARGAGYTDFTSRLQFRTATYYWSATDGDPGGNSNCTIYWILTDTSATFSQTLCVSNSNRRGYSVRCIKD